MKLSDEMITSRRNPTVVEAVKLSERKAREKEGLFRFDGLKLFGEAIEKGVCIERILICESRAENIIPRLKECEALESAIISVLSDEVFSKVSEEQAPEGLICIARFPRKHIRGAGVAEVALAADDKSRRIMMLESVRDPGNMGTVMRSAAAFGVDTLMISRDCADIYNPKTVRGAMGALFKLNILVLDDICQAIERLKESGRRVYAAALDKTAVRLDETTFSPCDVALVGNEGHGLSERAITASSQSLYIPMEEGSESLNAGVAASVILWSMYRR